MKKPYEKCAYFPKYNITWVEQHHQQKMKTNGVIYKDQNLNINKKNCEYYHATLLTNCNNFTDKKIELIGRTEATLKANNDTLKLPLLITRALITLFM